MRPRHPHQRRCQLIKRRDTTLWHSCPPHPIVMQHYKQSCKHVLRFAGTKTAKLLDAPGHGPCAATKNNHPQSHLHILLPEAAAATSHGPALAGSRPEAATVTHTYTRKRSTPQQLWRRTTSIPSRSAKNITASPKSKPMLPKHLHAQAATATSAVVLHRHDMIRTDEARGRQETTNNLAPANTPSLNKRTQN